MQGLFEEYTEMDGFNRIIVKCKYMKLGKNIPN